ncbi:MAG: isochorismatase family protein [Nannocystaceae bacterium]
MTRAHSRADALLVVDVQRGLVAGPRAIAGADALLARLTDLLAAARGAGVPILHLQDAGNDPDSRIPHGSRSWELALSVGDSELVIHKDRDDGFEGTALAERLADAGVRRLCVVGIQSEMCVAATARGATRRGYTVVLPRDGHATYDIPADGDAPGVPAALVSRVAEWSLGDAIVAPERTRDVVFGPCDD